MIRKITWMFMPHYWSILTLLHFRPFNTFSLQKKIVHILLNIIINPGSGLWHKHTQDSINTYDLSTDWATEADLQCQHYSRAGKKKYKSLMFRMIWEFFISIDQVWTSCVRTYAFTWGFKQHMRMLLILAFSSQVWTRLS